MSTTLAAIRAHSPCEAGWHKLLAHLGKTGPDNDPLPLSVILSANGYEDALWCLRAVKGRDRDIRLYAVWCARRVQYLMTDPRSVTVLDMAERFAAGRSTLKELTDAGIEAWAAGEAAAWAAWCTAWSTAWGASWSAAWASAEAEAEAAAGASWSAAQAAAGAEAKAAAEAARNAAWGTARAAQLNEFRAMIGA